MAKNIGIFREAIENYVSNDVAASYPSIFDLIGDNSEKPDQEVIDYILNAGYVEMGSTENAVDIISGKDTGMREITRTDGEFSWPISLAYYVDKYSMKLPYDFVRHVHVAKGK